MKESKKERLDYKLEALQCTGNILELYSVDRFSDIWQIVSPELTKVIIVNSRHLWIYSLIPSRLSPLELTEVIAEN